MIHVDAKYLGGLVVAGIAGAFAAMVLYCSGEKKKTPLFGFACLAAALTFAFLAGKYAGQTYYPCKTDFTTMKQECK